MGEQSKGTLVFRVEGMGCQGCVGRVKHALESVPKVKSAKVDLESKLAWVKGSASPADLEAAVKLLGKEATFLGSAAAEGFAETIASEVKLVNDASDNVE